MEFTMLGSNYETGDGMSQVVVAEKEREVPPQEIEIIELAPDGLGFGEGKISVKKQLENPELSGLTPEAMRIGAEIIKSGIPFLEVEADDDGCGDGRPAAVVYMLDAIRGGMQKFKKSLRRAKVFGGGLVVASSMYRVAIGGDVQSSETVLGDRVKMAGLLKDKIHYGGHTDNHAHGGKCGCGAIDLYPEITSNAPMYRSDITQVLRQKVYGEAEYANREAAINEVFDSYADQAAKAPAFFNDAQGVKTKELMEQNGSVIKQLNDDHLEDFLVINDVEGTTFDQRAFDAEMIKRGVTGTAQAFVVDAWRGRMYAEFIAEAAEKQGIDRQFAYQKAEADFWIRSLAVSATLTAGDQPVFMRRMRTNFAQAA
jgi:hypothetical protein